MTDVIDIISRLKQSLWDKYGNVLKKNYTQDEIHMTYYVSQVLEKMGYELSTDYRYSEAATNAAFIAGLRIGRMNAKEMADAEVEDRIANAISALNGQEF